MLDTLFESILLFKFIKESRFFNLTMSISQGLCPIQVGKISSLVHLAAHLHLVVELGACYHLFFTFYLLTSLAHILSCLSINVLIVQRPFVFIYLLRVLTLLNLVLKKLLYGLILCFLINQHSVFLDSELACIVVNMLPPEAILLLL